MTLRGSTDRANIEAAKARLPLPELLRKLGFDPPAAGEGNMRSPFAANRRQKTPSFSTFRRGDAWGWCDRTGGQEIKGDEITLLEKLEQLSRADAIARYLTLAGTETARATAAARNDKASSTDEFDWSAAVAKFTVNQLGGSRSGAGSRANFSTGCTLNPSSVCARKASRFPFAILTGARSLHTSARKTAAGFIRRKAQGFTRSSLAT